MRERKRRREDGETEKELKRARGIGKQSTSYTSLPVLYVKLLYEVAGG